MALKYLDLNKQSLSSESQEYGRQDVKVEAENFLCETSGDIPEWINGTIYKQAGGAFGKDHNQLDGLAHIVAFHLSKGKVMFSNKYMRTKDFHSFQKSGIRSWSGTSIKDKNKTITQHVKDWFKFFKPSTFYNNKNLYSDYNPNVTVWLMDNGKLLAAQTETGDKICSFDATTLETRGVVKTLNPMHNGIVVSTPAHYYREGSLGGYHVSVEVYYTFTTIIPTFTFYYNVYRGDKVPMKPVFSKKISEFRYDNRFKANKSFKRRPSYMHTLAVCKEFVVLLENSLKYDLPKLLNQDFSDGIFQLFPKVDIPVYFTVLRRLENGLEEILHVPCDFQGMIWHVGNCFYKNENIIFEAGCSKTVETSNFYVRFVIDLRRGTAKHFNLFVKVEFPIINPNFLFEENNFSYIVRNPLENGTLLKLRSDTSCAIDSPVKVVYEIFQNENLHVSEACFVPRPESIDEDDGVVLIMITDKGKLESYLAIVDAKSGDVLGRANAPVPINIGLHTIYVPSQDLSSIKSKL